MCDEILVKVVNNYIVQIVLNEIKVIRGIVRNVYNIDYVLIEQIDIILFGSIVVCLRVVFFGKGRNLVIIFVCVCNLFVFVVRIFFRLLLCFVYGVKIVDIWIFDLLEVGKKFKVLLKDLDIIIVEDYFNILD